ncbi:MAG: ATP-binding protein [Polyangiaceae bacterium]
MKSLPIVGQSAGGPAMASSDSDRVAELTRLLEARSRELEEALSAGAKNQCFVTRVVESMSSGLWVFDEFGRTEMVNAEGLVLSGVEASAARSISFTGYFPTLKLDEFARPGEKVRRQTSLRRACGQLVPVLLSASAMTAGPCERLQLIVTCVDLTEQRALEDRLRNAQKLEAVGQLAAGVAHEVNTPIQFIGDSVRFLQDCLVDLKIAGERTVALFDDLRARGATTTEDDRRFADIRAASDADFIFREAPAATERTLRGVARVAEIVRALRAFAHPDHDTTSLADVNRAITDAAVVAKVECKRVADLVVELGELPDVECNLNELTQVFLNLIVNASHAIEERPQGGRGTITVRSSAGPDFVRVTVTDDGAGIPEPVQARIFEPFFTTKPLGKGTGQGLALAHTFVEGHHRGTLAFTTSPLHGTTFSVRLPLRRDAGLGEAA